MFEKKEFTKVDRDYFKLITETAYHLTIKSKNTCHTWDIECREYPMGRSLIVSHKHKDSDPFKEKILEWIAVSGDIRLVSMSLLWRKLPITLDLSVDLYGILIRIDNS